MTERAGQTAGRADRILDAAAELLVRLGYRKVTIDDIARQAGIGKGTVYLHWRTKQQLFEAVLLREAISYVEELLDELRRDPAMLLPHRFIPASFLIVDRRPVLRALSEGYLRHTQSRPADAFLHSQELLASERFYDLMTRHGLFRDDVPNLAYTLSATMTGFHAYENLDPMATVPDMRAKVDSLAHVVRYAFESAEPPTSGELAKAVSEIIAVFEDLISPYRTWIYAYERTHEPG
ncbi:TetR/AcrR family transcriptional regulator [Streptosporangium amethystogenes]|uniref:TetR/AcrR family transcriptional regulator n=1 Tax=Streptosporangium amethystogenes TaxID=2002 RepID=UPI0004C9A9E9|nr:TetR/AcrR family transcriptional regulator [Streptosporangium amethystogenes]